MKVVLFCGGLGLRLRETGESMPKPLTTVGYRPILWHVMSYYAYYGFTDFVLCLGYRAADIKQYFLEYQEALSNDFILSKGGRELTLLNRDIDDWTIAFVDTGLHTNIGERLQAVKPYLADEEMFLANYADGLSDLPLDRYVQDFKRSGKIGCLLSVKPHFNFHLVRSDAAGNVAEIRGVRESDVRINGGFFAFRTEIFDYMRPGEELVEEPFARLIEAGQLTAYEYDGFWQCMDTFKDRMALEDLMARDEAPWQVWKRQEV
jgi:glucose-1-phosphate cytidylyltransferase